MKALRSQLPRKPRPSPEWRQALQLLARSPRGAIEDVLELGHGFSQEMLAMLVLAWLATLVTETLRVDDGIFTIERMRIRIQAQLIVSLFNDMPHSDAQQYRPVHLHPSPASSKSQIRCNWMLVLLA